MSPIGKSILPAKTIMSEALLSPPTEEERLTWVREHRERWFKQALDNILSLTSIDKSLKSQLEKRVAGFLEQPQGRPPKWNNAVRISLLIHYGHYLDGNADNHAHAMEELIAYELRMSDRQYSARSLNNKISESLRIPKVIGNVPAYLQPILRERLNRGEKQEIGKRKSP
jgi:hypothetical protein